MAKRRRHRSGSRRRSARQRAQLRQAQLISARKRSKGAKFLAGAKVAGQIAGGIAASAAIYHATEYAKHPDRAVRHAKALHGFVSNKSAVPSISRSRPAKRIGYYPSYKAQRALIARRR